LRQNNPFFALKFNGCGALFPNRNQTPHSHAASVTPDLPRPPSRPPILAMKPPFFKHILMEAAENPNVSTYAIVLVPLPIRIQ
jgi:hypothetical protein